MHVKRMKLQHFRNYENLSLDIHPQLNIFYGKNAQGKTNLLESLYLCGTGRSHRTFHEKEMIHWDYEESHIQIFLQKKYREERIDLHLKKNGKKGAALNGIAIPRLGELLGILNVVIFSPEDLQLIKSGPKERRRFLDIELCQLDRLYFHHLQKYYQVLKQRNALLKNLYHQSQIPASLAVWDEQLIHYGKKIIASRNDFIQKMNQFASSIHSHITAGKEKMEMEYIPNVSTELFEENVKKYHEKDMRKGSSSVGPHRDDILFKVNGTDLRIYGSQGQQRTAALSLKLAEIQLMKEEIGEYPILLLDDVLSELDHIRQTYLIEHIQEVQTILTCTGVEDLILKQAHQGYIFHVEGGKIVE